MKKGSGLGEENLPQKYLNEITGERPPRGKGPVFYRAGPRTPLFGRSLAARPVSHPADPKERAAPKKIEKPRRAPHGERPVTRRVPTKEPRKQPEEYQNPGKNLAYGQKNTNKKNLTNEQSEEYQKP